MKLYRAVWVLPFVTGIFMDVVTVTVPFLWGRALAWSDLQPCVAHLPWGTWLRVLQHTAKGEGPPTLMGWVNRDAHALVVESRPPKNGQEAPATRERYVPELWHLRPRARESLRVNLGAATRALEAFLWTWRAPQGVTHTARTAEGFWWAVLLLQMHRVRHSDHTLPALCAAFEAAHVEWLDDLLARTSLRHHPEALLDPHPLEQLEPCQVTQHVLCAFPGDNGPWCGAPMEDVWPLVNVRRGVLRAGVLLAPLRVLAPVVIHSRARRAVAQALAPWPRVDPALFAPAGPLADLYRYWFPRLRGVLMVQSDVVPRLAFRTVRDLPPCIVRAAAVARGPDGLPYQLRVLVWSALVAMGLTPSNLKAVAWPQDGRRQKGYTAEWNAWHKRQQQNASHPGPSCRKFKEADLCSFGGRCGQCAQTYAAPGATHAGRPPLFPSRMYALRRTVQLATEL